MHAYGTPWPTVCVVKHRYFPHQPVSIGALASSRVTLETGIRRGTLSRVLSGSRGYTIGDPGLRIVRNKGAR